MTTAPIDAEARGKLRLFKARLRRQCTAIDAALGHPSMREMAKAFSYRSNERGRARALKALCKALGPHVRLQIKNLKGNTPLALWMMMRSREGDPDSTDPAFAQDFVSVEYIAVGIMRGEAEDDTHKHCRVLTGTWTLDAPDHALGRLLQRARDIDPEAVLLNAHNAVLCTRVGDLVDTIIESQRGLNPIVNPGPHNTPYPGGFLLQAGPGAFVCTPLLSRNKEIVVRCPTWLHHEQLYDDRQWPLATRATTSAESFGHYLLPRQLRKD